MRRVTPWQPSGKKGDTVAGVWLIIAWSQSEPTRSASNLEIGRFNGKAEGRDGLFRRVSLELVGLLSAGVVNLYFTRSQVVSDRPILPLVAAVVAGTQPPMR